MYTKERSPGRFEGCESQMVAKLLQDLSLDGSWLTDEIGSVDDLGWYGRIDGKKYMFLMSMDHQGFFDYQVFRPELGERVWQDILNMYERELEAWSE